MSKQRRDSKHRNEFIEKLKSDPSFYPSYRDRLPDLLLSLYPEGTQTLGACQEIIAVALDGTQKQKKLAQDVIDKRREETGSRKKLDLEATYLRVKEIDTQRISKRLEIIFLLQTAKGSHYVSDFEDLKNIINGTLTKPQKKTRIAGHFIDQTLLTQSERKQPTLFDNDPITTEPAKSLEQIGDYIDHEDIGIRLNAHEHLVVSILQDIYQDSIDENKRLLSDNKQVVTVTDITKGGVNKHKLDTARIAFSLYEIVQRFYPGAKAGGREYRRVQSILDNLERKRFTIKYEHTDEKGNRWEVSTRDPLIKRYDIKPIEVVTEQGETISTYQIVYELKSIFIHQIETKKIYRPQNIPAKLREANDRAHGTIHIKDAVFQLYHELLRAVSSNTTRKDANGFKIYEIAEARLLDKIAPKLWEAKRKKDARDNLDKAIKTLSEAGLIVGVKGEGTKIVFTLNPDY